MYQGVFSTLGDTMMNVGGYHEYIGGCSVHWRDPLMSVGGCSVHWGLHTNSSVFPMTSPHIYDDIPHCTHDIPRCAFETNEKLFWKLVKSQRSSSQMSAFLVYVKMIIDKTDILKMWADHFETLSAPYDNTTFDKSFLQKVSC